MRKQVLDVEYSLDVVARLRIDGNAGIDILDNALHHILERGAYLEVDHIQTRCHHFLDRFTAKADNAFQNIVLLRKFGFIRQFQSMRKLVYRNVMILAHKMLVEE